LFADRFSPEPGIIGRPSGSQFSAEESEDLNVELERPALDTVIPKDELRNLKKEEKKRQEVINGNFLFIICFIMKSVFCPFHVY